MLVPTHEHHNARAPTNRCLQLELRGWIRHLLRHKERHVITKIQSHLHLRHRENPLYLDAAAAVGLQHLCVIEQDADTLTLRQGYRNGLAFDGHGAVRALPDVHPLLPICDLDTALTVGSMFQEVRCAAQL